MSKEKRQPSGNWVKVLQLIELNLSFQTLHQYRFKRDTAGKTENIKMNLPLPYFLFFFFVRKYIHIHTVMFQLG